MFSIIEEAVSAAFPNGYVTLTTIHDDGEDVYCMRVDSEYGYFIYILRKDEWAKDLGRCLLNAGVRMDRGTLWV